MSATQALTDEIHGLETQTWEALKESGTAMIPFLSQDCVMVFPGAGIISATSEPPLHDILNRNDMKPWTSYKLREVNVIPLGAEAASITYSVKAERNGAVYRASISSVWRSVGDGWRMVLHQQTPEVD